MIHIIFKNMFWDKFGRKNYINCNWGCFKEGSLSFIFQFVRLINGFDTGIEVIL